LGIKYRDIETKEAIAKGWVEGAGVVEVVGGSPAEAAVVKVGDIVIKIDGEKITSKNTVSSVIGNKKVGQEIKLTVWREGEEKTLIVTLKEAS